MGTELIILFALMCKHAVADLAIQSFRSPSKKRLWLNKGLHLHAVDHAVLTFIVLLFWVNPWLALGYALIDYVAHWHIDWLKSNILWIFGIPREGKGFWRLQTVDQILNYSTYMFIVSLIV